MSVIGSLEDLSFPDILQVVHVSRQTGTLILSAGDGERRVRFQDGLVCGATLGRGGPELEDLLVQKGLVDGHFLKAARDRRGRTGEPVGSALVALGAVSQETIEQVVREELRSILRSLVLLQEGEFRFVVDEEAPAPGGGELAIEGGLGPEALLPEGRGSAVPPRGARPDAASLPRAPGHVLLVIDRAVVRLALRDDLQRRRVRVEAAATPAAALELARSLTGRGARFALVCDLMLPDASGKGWRGGLDLVRQIAGLSRGLVAIMVGEVRDPAVAQEARAAGAVGYLPLPDLGCGLGDVGARLAQFCAEVRAALARPDRLAAGGGIASAEPVRAVDQLSLLRGLVGEMHGEAETEIPLLVLRLAAEYFERGILFAIEGEEALGTGAFGGDADGVEGSGLDGRIRGVALPILRGSVLHRAVQERASYVGPIAPSRPNAALLERLGSPNPKQAALLPLPGSRRTLGLLYGDNAPSGRPVGDLKGLEIFLSQAGIALENALLQRRIASLARGGARDAAGSHE